ncbi:bacteriocin [Enterococcus faecium]|nr:bacteriocin [Enterococcus faecium]
MFKHAKYKGTKYCGNAQTIGGGNNAWGKLGQVVGGLTTGAVGGAGLETAICGPACGVVGGLYGAVAGGAAAGWDARKK